MQQITVGSFTPSVVLDVAERTGRLSDHGLATTEVPVTSSPAQFRSMLDGDIDVALTSPDNVLAYRFEPENPLGATTDARIVAAIDRGMGLGLYGRPDTGPKDLDGARIGVDVPTSGFALALYALAESLGVARDRYDLVALGSTPRRLEALLAGDCAATMLNTGNELIAEQAGCVRLAGADDLLTPYLGTVVAVVGDRHLEAATRLSAALVATAARISAGELDAVAAGSAARRLRLDDALAQRYVDRLRDPRNGLVPDGAVDPDAIATLVDLRQRYLPGSTLTHRMASDPGLVSTR